MYYTINGEIYHHGILGMKWGKRNGPPYPLGASAHSASERKAGYKKSIGGGRNESEYNRNKRSDRNYRSNNQNRKPKSTSQKVADVFNNVAKDDAKKSAKKAAAAALDMTVAVSAAAITSAVVLNMAKKGKVDAAQVVAKYAKVGVQQLKNQAKRGAAAAAFTLTTAAVAKGVSMTAKAVDANKKKSNKSKVDSSQGGLIAPYDQKSKELYEKMQKAASNHTDFYDTDYLQKAEKEAYDKTLDFYKKNYPDEFKQIVKDNNNSTDNLTAYHGFRRIFEGFDEEAITKYEAEWYKTPEGQESIQTEKEFEKAYAAYVSYVNETNTKKQKEG